MSTRNMNNYLEISNSELPSVFRMYILQTMKICHTELQLLIETKPL